MRRLAIIVVVGTVLLAGCTGGQDAPAASTRAASPAATHSTEAEPAATPEASASAPPEASASPSATAEAPAGDEVTSPGGSLSATIPAAWSRCDPSAGLASADALDVLGEWGLTGGCGSADTLVAVESLASPDPGATAEGYYEEAFAPTEADPTLELAHEAFVNGEGYEVLLVTVTSTESGADGATFIVFAGDRLVVGKLSSATVLDAGEVADFRRVAASVVVR